MIVTVMLMVMMMLRTVMLMVMMMRCMIMFMIVMMRCMVMLMVMMVLRVVMSVFMMKLRMHVPVQIRHVMIVIVMILIQDHVEIAGIDPGLFDPADPDLISVQGKGGKRRKKAVLIRAQIQQRSHGHISADPAGAVKIKCIQKRFVAFVHDKSPFAGHDCG